MKKKFKDLSLHQLLMVCEKNECGENCPFYMTDNYLHIPANQSPTGTDMRIHCLCSASKFNEDLLDTEVEI